MTHKLSKEDRNDIINCYLVNNFSIRLIHDFFYPDLSVSTLARILDSDPKAHMKKRLHMRGRRIFDDTKVYREYRKRQSLRKVAEEFDVTPMTIRKHVIRYQRTHPLAKRLIRMPNQ